MGGIEETLLGEDAMSYGDRAARLCGDREPFPLTALYVEMTEEFYDVVGQLIRDNARDEHEEKLARTFEDGAREFVRTLRAWHELGQRSTFARPELEQFEMRARKEFFDEIGTVIEILRGSGEISDKGEKAKEASDSLKDLIPNSIWGIDITWLKRLLNEILSLIL